MSQVSADHVSYRVVQASSRCRGLLVGLAAGRGGLASDHVRGAGLLTSGQADVQGLPGQLPGDQEVGGVDGAALGDVHVAAVGQLGASGQVGPGNPEPFVPGPV